MKIFPRTSVVELTDSLLHLKLAPHPILTVGLWAPFLGVLISLPSVDWGVIVPAGCIVSLLFFGIGYAPHGFGRCLLDKKTGSVRLSHYALFQWGEQSWRISGIKGVLIYKESETLFSVLLETGDETTLLQSGMAKDKAQQVAQVISQFLDVPKSYKI